MDLAVAVHSPTWESEEGVLKKQKLQEVWPLLPDHNILLSDTFSPIPMEMDLAVAVHSPTWESEEGVLKKQKLQEVWPGKDKVCLALLCFKINENGDACKREYNICVFDLLDSVPIGDPSYFLPISPVLNIDCGGFDNVSVRNMDVRNMDTDAFWVFGQKVYMFEGSHSNGRKAVYSFDISAPSQRRIVKSEISEICNMHSPKRHHTVVPIPNSKNLLVFPTEFLVEDSTSEYIGGFELFDPAKKSLDRLPHTDIKASTYWKLCTYGFIDATRFLIQLTFVSQFVQLLVLDFDKLHEGWVYFGDNYGGLDLIPSWLRETSSFELIEDQFCVTTPYGAYDLRLLDTRSSLSNNIFKALDLESAILYHVDNHDLKYMVALLNHDKEKEECHLCEAYVDTSFDKQSQIRILLDVSRVDLKWYKQDYLTLGFNIYKPNYTSSVKPVQFCVDLGGEYQVHVLSMFTI